MITSTDQLGREIELQDIPKRIVSLVPSQTDLLAGLGLEDEVVGITKFCVHPESWYKTKQRVGGTKELKLDVIDSLNPDLIIANKEENDEGQINQLAEKYNVWVSDVNSIDSALEMIREVGNITGKGKEAADLVAQIKDEFKTLKPLENTRVAYFVWRMPYLVAGNNTFIHSILEAWGLENVFADQERYPQIDLKLMETYKADLILLPSEPFPFDERHMPEFLEASPGAAALLVDGEIFSWYGRKMLNIPAYLNQLAGN
jgi:ABC-type Fe3+-hydroxamate transport system substrate-binding protein